MALEGARNAETDGPSPSESQPARIAVTARVQLILLHIIQTAPRKYLRERPHALNQKEPESIASPPAIVPRAIQITGLTVCLANRTDPSASIRFTPPGWRLVAVTKLGLS